MCHSMVSAIEQTPLTNNWDILALHRHSPLRYPHLLESAVSGTRQGRYDILFACPGVFLTGSLQQFISLVNEVEVSCEKRSDSSDLPFQGGWFFYLGYELAHQIEPVLGVARSHPWGWETLWMQYFPAAVIHDHVTDKRYLISPANETALRDRVLADIHSCDKATPPGLKVAVDQLQEESAEHFIGGVERIKSYIREGDIFQANLSRLWTGGFSSTPSTADVYAALRKHNPAPFSALATWKNRAIISSSPERLVLCDDGWISTRPIAGTYPRHDDLSRDQALLRALLSHPKERAEHVMMIDLERNDLGRIALPGTVEVDEFMVTETYAHVHHIVSNIRARPRADIRMGDLLAALFPGGTITGCPKIRCMQILSELETDARGAYTGSLGYVSQHGRLDMNILIRTLEKDGEQFRFRTGAGIVADSVIDRELAETRHKAEGILRALR